MALRRADVLRVDSKAILQKSAEPLLRGTTNARLSAGAINRSRIKQPSFSLKV
jgi:hypothetical protein